MNLIVADLRAALNGLRRDGRGALGSRLLPPILLGCMYWLIGRMLLQHWDVLPMVKRGGDPVAYLIAHGLGPCPVVAGWIGFAHAQRMLFEAPELNLWLCAPHWRGRAALQVLLRSGSTAMLWAIALTLPMLWQLLELSGSGPLAFAVLPVAIATAVLPSLCAVMALQVTLMRLARGRLARMFLGSASALAAFGFPMFLLAQVFAGTSGQAADVTAAARSGATPSPLVAAASRIVEAGVHDALTLAVFWPAIALLAAGAAVFLLAAPLHPVAAQNHLLAHRARRVRERRWPGSAAAAMRRKEFAQLLQQPGAMLHMLLVGGMVYLVAAQRMFVREILQSPALPEFVRQGAAMLALWFLAVLMLLYAHMGRLAIWDGAQWPLYVQSPTRPMVLLRSKLQVIATLLLWPVLVAAIAGVHWFDADLRAVGTYLLFALPGNLVALATVAAIGTWPWLVRREIDGRLVQGSRGLVGSIVLVLGFYLALSPAVYGWLLVTEHNRFVVGGFERTVSVPLLAAVAATYALTVGAIALWLGTRNYRVLLRAR